MKQQKDVIAGLGEIGQPLYKILSKSTIVVGYDKKGFIFVIIKI